MQTRSWSARLDRDGVTLQRCTSAEKKASDSNDFKPNVSWVVLCFMSAAVAVRRFCVSDGFLCWIQVELQAQAWCKMLFLFADHQLRFDHRTERSPDLFTSVRQLQNFRRGLRSKNFLDEIQGLTFEDNLFCLALCKHPRVFGPDHSNKDKDHRQAFLLKKR